METMTNIAIITDSRYLEHDTGGMDHPETPLRLQVILDQLKRSDLSSSLTFYTPDEPERAWLTSSHDEAWLFRFEESVLAGKSYIDHTDNQVCYDSYNIACLAASAGIKGVDLLEQGEVDKCFCLVRPPGHHAEKNMPFGFCFFNNSVIAARYWQQKYGKKRILIFDFDAHHGNGIQSAFEHEADSYYVSIHQHPSFSYPGTGYSSECGFNSGKGTILNLPLQPFADDEQVLKLITAEIEPKLKEWQPDAIVISAGFDGHISDDMSDLHYSTDLYRRIGGVIKKWSDQYTQGKMLSILEGGYELSVLAESVEAYTRGLLDR